MFQDEAAVRYFRRVYPRLRSVHGSEQGVGLGRRMTEPGRRERMIWVLRFFGADGPHRVLDAGCGDGAYAIALARRGHHVTALDLSDDMLAVTAARARAAGVAERVRLVNGDLRTWTARENFDTVLCLGVAEYYERAADLIARMFALTERSLLVTLSRTDTGPREILRRIWLGLHGVRGRLYSRSDLETCFHRLGDAEIAISETRWTHCLEIHRRAAAMAKAVRCTGIVAAPRTLAP